MSEEEGILFLAALLAVALHPPTQIAEQVLTDLLIRANKTKLNTKTKIPITTGKQKRGGKFSPAIHKAFKDIILKDVDGIKVLNWYPEESEKLHLVDTYSLTINQVNDYLSNARRRGLPKN